MRRPFRAGGWGKPGVTGAATERPLERVAALRQAQGPWDL